MDWHCVYAVWLYRVCKRPFTYPFKESHRCYSAVAAVAFVHIWFAFCFELVTTQCNVLYGTVNDANNWETYQTASFFFYSHSHTVWDTIFLWFSCGSSCHFVLFARSFLNFNLHWIKPNFSISKISNNNTLYNYKYYLII